jgi:hypothetical protein
MRWNLDIGLHLQRRIRAEERRDETWKTPILVVMIMLFLELTF